MGRKSIINEDEVVATFLTTFNTKLTAVKLNIKQSQVQYTLKKRKLNLTVKTSHIKYTVNHDYFANIDNEEKA